MAKKDIEVVEAVEVEKKVAIQSVLNGTLQHPEVTIGAGEIVMVEPKLAEELIKTGYVKALKIGGR